MIREFNLAVLPAPTATLQYMNYKQGSMRQGAMMKFKKDSKPHFKEINHKGYTKYQYDSQD